MIEVISSTWSPGSIAIALLGGAGTGWLLGMVLPPNPAYHGRWRIVVGFGVIGFCGLVFYVGQTLEAWAAGEQWERVASRASLWLLFSLALAVAGYLAHPAASGPFARRWVGDRPETRLEREDRQVGDTRRELQVENDTAPKL